jgi:hypothetical protein
VILKTKDLQEVRKKLLNEQNGCCAICKRSFSLTLNARGTALVACVDHDHQTGYVRGVLCAGCNGLEGKLRGLQRRAGLSQIDLADWAAALADYLRQEQTNLIHPAHGTNTRILAKRPGRGSASRGAKTSPVPKTESKNVREIIKKMKAGA